MKTKRSKFITVELKLTYNAVYLSNSIHLVTMCDAFSSNVKILSVSACFSYFYIFLSSKYHFCNYFDTILSPFCGWS